MFRPVILTVLFWRVHGHVGGGAILSCHMATGALLQHAAVAKVTVCVTFGAPRFGPKWCSTCEHSEYATFCTISATAVREMTVCVTFGAPHFGVPLPILRPTTPAVRRMEAGLGDCGVNSPRLAGICRVCLPNVRLLFDAHRCCIVQGLVCVVKH